MSLTEQSAGGVPALRSVPVTTSQAFIRGGSLALDLSSTVGWAYGDYRFGIPATGTWHLPHIGGEGARYASFENELAAAMDRWAPAGLVLEAPLPLPAQTAFKSAAQQFGLRAVAFSEGWRGSAAVSEIDVGTARAEVMGQRRYSKDQVKKQVFAFCKARGIAVNSHHAGDAAVIWLWHRQRMMNIPPCAGPLWRESI